MLRFIQTCSLFKSRPFQSQTVFIMTYNLFLSATLVSLLQLTLFLFLLLCTITLSLVSRKWLTVKTAMCTHLGYSTVSAVLIVWSLFAKVSALVGFLTLYKLYHLRQVDIDQQTFGFYVALYVIAFVTSRHLFVAARAAENTPRKAGRLTF